MFPPIKILVPIDKTQRFISTLEKLLIPFTSSNTEEHEGNHGYKSFIAQTSSINDVKIHAFEIKFLTSIYYKCLPHHIQVEINIKFFEPFYFDEMFLKRLEIKEILKKSFKSMKETKFIEETYKPGE